jgi:hypothetical protein
MPLIALGALLFPLAAVAGSPPALPQAPDCGSGSIVDKFVCATPALGQALTRIDLAYDKADRSHDADVRFLASKDQSFFARRLANCNSARAPTARTPRDLPEACAAWVIWQKDQVLARPLTADILKVQIATSGVLDVETVERFPQDFAGVDARFAVTVDLKKDSDTSLAGTFTQPQAKRTWPVVVPDAKSATLNFFSVHPSVSTSVFGHMEPLAGVLTLVMADDGVY